MPKTFHIFVILVSVVGAGLLLRHLNSKTEYGRYALALFAHHRREPVA